MNLPVPAKPEIAPRKSPNRFLAVLHLAKRECGNCKHFDLPLGQLTLARKKNFGEVMKHVPPTQIGLPDPVGALVAEQRKVSPEFADAQEEVVHLNLRIENVTTDDLREKLVVERDGLEAKIGALMRAHPRLAELEREIERVEHERENHITTPDELWINYGQCAALRKIVFSGYHCEKWG